VSAPLTDFQVGARLAGVLAKGVRVEPVDDGTSLRLRTESASERLSDLVSDFDVAFLREHRDRILALLRGERTETEPTRPAPPLEKSGDDATPSRFSSAAWARPQTPPDEPVVYFGERRVDADDVALMLSGLDDDAQVAIAKLPLVEQYAMTYRWLVQRRHIVRADARRG
jgi:hypothetical protein